VESIRIQEKEIFRHVYCAVIWLQSWGVDRVVVVSVVDMRWKEWLRDIDHITKFLKTGEICSKCQMSETDQNDLVQAAQKYYIESK